MSNIDTFQATFLYANLQKERICVGAWTCQSMIQCVRKHKFALLFPHLVIALYKHAKVLIGWFGRFLQPTKNPIQEPNVKHFVGCQNHKWDDHGKSNQGVSDLPDSKWIIRWKLEAELIYIDHARINDLRMPQFPFVKYHAQLGLSKIEEEDLKEEEEDPREEEDPKEDEKELEPNSD